MAATVRMLSHLQAHSICVIVQEILLVKIVQKLQLRVYQILVKIMECVLYRSMVPTFHAIVHLALLVILVQQTLMTVLVILA